MRKASSSHKKFTATFAINMEGKIYKPHCLFSNIKNKPHVAEGCLVDFNKTGMWSEAILNKYIENVVIKRPETSIFRKPTLLLIDHYGPHVTLANSKRLEKYDTIILSF